MARIEVNSNDLDLLDEEMKSAITKIDNFIDFVSPGLTLTKQDSLYSNGFAKIVNYELGIKDSIKDVDERLNFFREELENLENVYTSKFESIKVPILPVISSSDDFTTDSPIDEDITPPTDPTVIDDELLDVPLEDPGTGSDPLPIYETVIGEDIDVVPLEDPDSGHELGTIPFEEDIAPVGEDISEVPLFDMSSPGNYYRDDDDDDSYGPAMDVEEIPTDEAPQEDELARLMSENQNSMSVTDSIANAASETMAELEGEF